jgi:hypothetical protein
MRESTAAIAGGSVQNADKLALQQVEALEEMARYFHDAWDGQRVIQFLTNVDERLRVVSPAGAATPEFMRLRAGRLEIAGDKDADDDRFYDAAARKYNDALELFDQYQKIKSRGGLASARVHRKLAALRIAQEDYAVADSHIRAAGLLLDGSDQALSERAGLNDLMAGEDARRHDNAQARRLIEEAVALDRQVLAKARQAGQPILKSDLSVGDPLAASW